MPFVAQRSAALCRGRVVAAVLRGSWRATPPSPTVTTAELSLVAPLLHQLGSGALAWWALRNSALRDSAPAQKLRQIYRFDALRAAMRQADLERTIAVLQAAGIKPLLAKGWLASGLYPEPGLRPYEDIDLLVKAEDLSPALKALECEDAGRFVDLHLHFFELKDRHLDELHRRSLLMTVGQVDVAVLGPEDHLRLLGQHLLRHGAWRPAWLCDIGAALESLPPGFDWDYCLWGDERRTHWMMCAFALAQLLLAARLPHWLGADEPMALPSWLPLTVLREWGKAHAHRPPGPLRNVWRKPFSKLAFEELRCRWPNGIVATVFTGAAFDAKPRLPLQVTNYLISAARAAASSEHGDVPLAAKGGL